MISSILGGVMLAYLLVGFLFLSALLWNQARLDQWARVFLWSGWAAQSVAVDGRWVESYRLAAPNAPPADFLAALQLAVLQVPLSNIYESLVFFVLCLPVLGLLSFRRHVQGFLGAMVALLACLLLAYASLGLTATCGP